MILQKQNNIQKNKDNILKRDKQKTCLSLRIVVQSRLTDCLLIAFLQKIQLSIFIEILSIKYFFFFPFHQKPNCVFVNFLTKNQHVYEVIKLFWNSYISTNDLVNKVSSL